MYKIYGLCSSEDYLIRYIGYTSISIDDRAKKHYYESGTTKKNNWIKSIKSKEHRLIPILIDEYENRRDALKMEICYIKTFKSFGANLVNGTDGGDGVTMTPEIRKKISEANKGKCRITDYQRRRIAETRRGKPSWNSGIKTNKPSWNKGIKMTEDAKLKLSIQKRGVPNYKNRGKIMSDEHKIKLSESRKGKGSWNKGKKMTTTHPMLGKKHSKETILKMSLAKKGKAVSPEHRHKISESMKIYRAKRAAATMLLTTANYPAAQAVNSIEGQP